MIIDFIIILALFLFSFFIKRHFSKTLKKAALWAGLFILLFIIIFSLVHMLQFNSSEFSNSTAYLMNKAQRIQLKAEKIDQKTALARLGKNRQNGFYFRLGDHLHESEWEILDCTDHQKTQTGLELPCYEFNSSENPGLINNNEKVLISDGKLIYTASGGTYFHSHPKMAVPRDSVSEIHIRMKLLKGSRLSLGWSKFGDANPRNYDQDTIGFASIRTNPDGKFHTYVFRAKESLSRSLLPGDIIRKFFIKPSDIPGDEIEIEFIRFISKKNHYTDTQKGLTYENKLNQYRKAIYSCTPGRYIFELQLPEQPAVLSFGMGILAENDPVTFNAFIENKNIQDKIFSRTLSNTSQWTDAKIDLKHFAGKTIKLLLEADSQNGNIAFWTNPVVYTSPEKNFNVIIVLEDALRPDHLSLYGYAKKTSPFKDRWSRNGVVFSRAVSQATSTRMSVASMMTSLYGVATGVWTLQDSLNANYVTLAEVMRHQGFATASFIQNGNAGVYAGLHQGFSTLFNKSVLGQADKIYNRDLYKWMDDHKDRNFFIYLHLIDPHAVYDPPPPYDSIFLPGTDNFHPVKYNKYLDPPHDRNPTLEKRISRYDGEIKYNDDFFKEFLQKLEKYDLTKNTLIIFISDHGEHFNEHKLWGKELWEHKPPGFIQGIQVPMIMVYPGRFPLNKTIPQSVQLLDIMPTVLEAAQIPFGALMLEGESLLPLICGQNMNFWNNRLVLSHELIERVPGERNESGSVFFHNLHIINSHHFFPYKKLFRKAHEKLPPVMGWPYNLIKKQKSFFLDILYKTRIYNLAADLEEKHGFGPACINPFLKYKAQRFMKKFEKINLSIHETITVDKKQKFRIDPKTEEELKALGYIR